MTRTAYAMSALGEIGIARGHAVGYPRPAGDAVTRYGMGPSLVRVPATALAGAFENSFGPGSSQTLFVLEQILLVLLAAAAAGALARGVGVDAAGTRRPILAAAIASPLWAYASSDWSEPLQAACVGGAFACAALATREGVLARQASTLAAFAGAAAGFALLSKSILIVLFPCVLAVLWFGSARSSARAAVARRMRRMADSGGALARLRDRALRASVRLLFGRALQSSRPRRALAPHRGPEQRALPVFPARSSRRPRVSCGSPGRGEPSRFPLSGFSLFLLVTTAAWWSWDGTSGWGPAPPRAARSAPRRPRSGRRSGDASSRFPRAFRNRRLCQCPRGPSARRRPRVVLRDPQAEAAVSGGALRLPGIRVRGRSRDFGGHALSDSRCRDARRPVSPQGERLAPHDALRRR